MKVPKTNEIRKAKQDPFNIPKHQIGMPELYQQLIPPLNRPDKTNRSLGSLLCIRSKWPKSKK